MSPKEILIDTANLIDTTGWCQGSYAKLADGTSVGSADSRAVCFCITGAIFKVTKSNVNDYFPVNKILRDKLESMIYVWNDKPGRTKEEVVSKLKEIAADLE